MKEDRLHHLPLITSEQIHEVGELRAEARRDRPAFAKRAAGLAEQADRNGQTATAEFWRALQKYAEGA